MRNTERAQLRVNSELLRRARRMLKSPSDKDAAEQALAEAIANREVEAALKHLVRRGRGHFVDLNKADA